MTYPTDGILLIDKNAGETSYDVTRKIKVAFRGSKIRKFGHSGTLDPFATGLLIILLGQGTKLSSFIMSESKVYRATMRLGIETDTLDPTGRITRESVVPDLSVEFIKETSQKFNGVIEQTPPIYSAVKYKGKRAYELARGGQEVVLQKRNVSIYSFEIISVELPDVTMQIKCSSGTYIRSLASDFARELGPGGHLRSLRRLACGSFNAKNALNSKDILTVNSSIMLHDKMISLNSALPEMREIVVGNSVAKKVRQGLQSALDGLVDDLDPVGFNGRYFKIVEKGELVAVVKQAKSRRDGHVKLEIARVFF